MNKKHLKKTEHRIKENEQSLKEDTRGETVLNSIRIVARKHGLLALQLVQE